MSDTSVSFKIGTAKELQSWFSFSPNVQQNPNSPSTLKDAIEHSVNQTLLRDLYYGAWAVVSVPDRYRWSDDDEYSIRISSPDADVSAYKKTLPVFLQTIGQGLAIYTSRTKKSDDGKSSEKGVQNLLASQRACLIGASACSTYPLTDAAFACSFLPPFGLSMVRTNSIQLLHYPPDETVTYMDYLYSPTNRRWENLLGYNGQPGAENTLLETIVDIAPIAAPGGSRGGQLIAPVLEHFQPYAMTMLNTLLRANDSNTMTLPVVAYGSPVGEWLYANFADELKSQNVALTEVSAADDQCQCEDKDRKRPKPAPGFRPNVGQVFKLQILKDGPATPVMCANHPIKFNYYDSDYEKALKAKDVAQEISTDVNSATTLAQDLIAAGWQVEMGGNWNSDTDPDEYRTVEQKMFEKWTTTDGPVFEAFIEVFKSEVTEFALQSMPEVGTEKWEQQLRTAAATALTKMREQRAD